mgnify:CR=1 FL=1
MIDDSQIQRFKPLLDFIAEHEGTADEQGGGYDTSLGYGRYIEGGERKLTDLTLDQIDVLQTAMLRNPDNPFNSSALGRYQIVRMTLRGLRKELRLSPTDRYSAQLQDWLAVRLIKRRGRNAAALRLEWASLKRATDRDILAAYDLGGRGDDRRRETEEEQVVIASRTSTPAAPGTFPIKRGSDQKALIIVLQEALAQRNYFVGKIDGLFGSLTTGAVAAFQIDFDLQPDVFGEVDEATWARLSTAGSRPLSEGRLDSTAADLRRDGSIIISNADRARLAGIIMAALGALGIGSAVTSGPPANSVSATELANTLSRAAPSDLQTFLPAGVKIDPKTIIDAAAAKKVVPVPAPAPQPADLVAGAIVDVANLFLPNVGGGIATLALGLLTSLFSTRIIDRRVADQRSGRNIGPMKTGNRQS